MRPICLMATIIVKAAVLSSRVVVRDTSPNSAAPAPAPIPTTASHNYSHFIIQPSGLTLTEVMYTVSELDFQMIPLVFKLEKSIV